MPQASSHSSSSSSGELPLARQLREALHLHRSGQLNPAEALYRQILQEDPEQLDALRLLGVLARQTKQYPLAGEMFCRALRIDPRSAAVHQDLGLLYCELNRTHRAVECFRAALELQPSAAETHHNLGNALCDLWDLEGARKCFASALALQPGLSEPKKSLQWVEKMEKKLQKLARFLQVNPGAISPPAGSADDEKPPPRLPHRKLLPHLLNELALAGAGIEVGVKEGEFSEHLLRWWKGRILYSVDPWREFGTGDYVDVANVPQRQHDAYYRQTLQRLMEFGARSVVWRLTSLEAASLVQDLSLDFCYLDADHSYDAVRQDLETWFPKVKLGGILAGHDYIPDGHYSFGVFGVMKAVHEFAQRHGLPLFTTNEPQFPSWFVRKPAAG